MAILEQHSQYSFFGGLGLGLMLGYVMLNLFNFCGALS